MIARSHIAPDFFADAGALREALDAVFDRPYEPSFAWQYFHVPQLYTYLRARSEELLPAALIGRFNERLRSWCANHLGMSPTASPMLHVMVNGCNLSLHSDYHNGAFGYVYSLTRWEQRSFSGGETLLLHDGVPNYKRHQAHGEALYQLIPARFNQLLLFDNRIVHATPAIQGGMDPKAGRIALVGHLRAARPQVAGALPDGLVREALSELLRTLKQTVPPAPEVQGIVTLRAEVAADGRIAATQLLVDSLVTAATGYAPSDDVNAVRGRLMDAVAGHRFPPAAGATTVVFAILWPIPDLRPVRVSVRHHRPPSEIGPRIEAFLREQSIAGSFEISDDEAHLELDPPMWVASQRAQFEASLAAALNELVSSD